MTYCFLKTAEFIEFLFKEVNALGELLYSYILIRKIELLSRMPSEKKLLEDRSNTAFGNAYFFILPKATFTVNFSM